MTQHDNIKLAALQYAEMGLRVIPLCSYDHFGMNEKHREQCSKQGKAPLLGNWTNKASNDPGTVAVWFGKYKTANVGVLTGTAGGIVAIDVDGDYGRERLAELSGGEMPETWEFTTPGGGYRYMFLAPDVPVLRTSSDPLPGSNHQELAFLGDNRQTVMPPSRHRNGGKYEWVEGRSPDDIEIGSAPDWMIQLMSDQYAADSLFEDEPENAHCEVGISKSPAASVDRSTSTSTSMSMSTSTSGVTPVQADFMAGLKGMPKLAALANKCPAICGTVEEQLDGGCHEGKWFNTVSLLCRIGAGDEALAFSRLSDLKHNADSELRIRKVLADAEAKNYGPPRCSAFGCGETQVCRCFERLRRNARGEVSNSPAWFLTHDFDALARIEALLTRTRYRIKDGKLVEPTFNKKGEEDGFSGIANFVVIPVRDICVDNGEETMRFFEFEAVLIGNGKTLDRMRVSHTDFADLKWTSNWGMMPNLEPGLANKERMRHAIQQLASSARQVQIYGHLGFRRIGGHWRYLHAGGCVGESGIDVEVERRLGKYVLPERAADAKAAVRQSLSLLEVAERPISTLLLALVYLAPLCETLRQVGLEPSFVVWLYGQTGTMKSTVAALFLCHFGIFTAKGPPTSFKDTANSLERRAFDVKDSLLWIDDFHPSSNPAEARKMEQVAQSLLRAYGDRVGRGRMRSDASLRPDYPPRGLVVATGEMLPDGHSSNARMQTAELTHGKVDRDKLTAAQSRTHLLAEAMSEYVSWVGKRMDDPDYPERLARKFRERRDLALPSQSHGRLAEATAWLSLGLDSLLEFAEETGAVSDAERQEKLDTGWKTLLTLSEAQSEQVDDVSPSRQFLSVVAGMLQNGSLHLLPADRKEREKYDGVPLSGTNVGYKDDDYFYFLPDILFNAVNAFLARQDERVPLKQEALWKQLEAAGCLVPETTTENGKEKTKRRRRKIVDGKRVQTVWVKRESLEEPEAAEIPTQAQVRHAALHRKSQALPESPFADA